MARPEKSDALLAAFSDFEWQRAELARKAAECILEECDGRTTSSELFALAALGERLTSDTPGSELLSTLGRVMNSDSQGQPICIWTPVPQRCDRTEFGIIGSFSEEAFEPIRFIMDPRYPRERDKFDAWDSQVQIAVQSVIGRKGDERLYEQATGVDVMYTRTIFNKKSDRNRLPPLSVGGMQAAFISIGAKAVDPETSSPNPFGGTDARLWLAERFGDTVIEGEELKPIGTFGYYF